MLVFQLKRQIITQKLVNFKNHDRYVTTPEFNTLAADVSNARLAQANLITKTDFDAKLSSHDRKITGNKSKHVLVETELKMVKTFDSSCFIDKSHFEEDGKENYLVFMYRYFEQIAGVRTGSYIYYEQSKRLLGEKINSVKTPSHSITPNPDV